MSFLKNKFWILLVVLVVLVVYFSGYLNYGVKILGDSVKNESVTTQRDGDYFDGCPVGMRIYDAMNKDFIPSAFNCNEYSSTNTYKSHFEKSQGFPLTCYGAFVSPSDWKCKYNFYCCVEE